MRKKIYSSIHYMLSCGFISFPCLSVVSAGNVLGCVLLSIQGSSLWNSVVLQLRPFLLLCSAASCSSWMIRLCSYLANQSGKELLLMNAFFQVTYPFEEVLRLLLSHSRTRLAMQAMSNPSPPFHIYSLQSCGRKFSVEIDHPSSSCIRIDENDAMEEKRTEGGQDHHSVEDSLRQCSPRSDCSIPHRRKASAKEALREIEQLSHHPLFVSLWGRTRSLSMQKWALAMQEERGSEDGFTSVDEDYEEDHSVEGTVGKHWLTVEANTSRSSRVESIDMDRDEMRRIFCLVSAVVAYKLRRRRPFRWTWPVQLFSIRILSVIMEGRTTNQLFPYFLSK